MKKRQFVLGGLSLAGLSACGGGGESGSGGVGSTPSLQNRFIQANLAASAKSYKAKYTLPDMVSAWGIAIRPAGSGGHFWVGAGGSSWQFVGDVKNSANTALREIGVDQLTRINPKVGTVPLDGTRFGAVTG